MVSNVMLPEITMFAPAAPTGGATVMAAATTSTPAAAAARAALRALFTRCPPLVGRRSPTRALAAQRTRASGSCQQVCGTSAVRTTEAKPSALPRTERHRRVYFVDLTITMVRWQTRNRQDDD